jgi:hypothetical protein
MFGTISAFVMTIDERGNFLFYGQVGKEEWVLTSMYNMLTVITTNEEIDFRVISTATLKDEMETQDILNLWGKEWKTELDVEFNLGVDKTLSNSLWGKCRKLDLATSYEKALENAVERFIEEDQSDKNKVCYLGHIFEEYEDSPGFYTNKDFYYYDESRNVFTSKLADGAVKLIAKALAWKNSVIRLLLKRE